MKEVTLTYTVYSFGELSEEAKEKAIETARNDPGRAGYWAEEWRQVIETAQEVLPEFQVKDWGVSYTTISTDRIDDEILEMSPVRLWKYLKREWGSLIEEDCPFTGYCGDEALLKPLRNFLKNPGTFHGNLADLMQEMADSWRLAWAADIEYSYSDEAITAELISMGEAFLEDGAFA